MSRQTAPALRRGLDILELIEERGRLRVPEITQHLELPRATTHELVNTLVDRGYLELSRETGRVSLGARALRLASGFERDLDVASVGRECAAEVAADCGETVQIVVRDGTHAVFVVRIDSTRSVRLVSHVGSRIPAACTAGGKALLAALDPAELARLFPDDAALEPMTARSIDTVARLHEELDTVRTQGWSQEYCESNEDVACVAAPVVDRAGTCVAAMSISVPVLRWGPEQRDEYLRLVRRGAAGMSRRLGA